EEAAQALYRKMFVDGIDVENLPEGWRMGCLGEVCSKIGSGSTPKGGQDSYLSEGISFIRSMNVFDSFFERNDLAHITEGQAKALDSVTVQDKDILLNITGASVGRCCMVPSDILPARVNQHVMIIRAKESTYQHFLLYQINNENTKRELLTASESGSTREALTKREVELQKILIPSKDAVISFNDKIEIFCDSIFLKSRENEILMEMLSVVMVEESRI
ncbi:MAG: restriction endonuclease subunit S, partial [Bacteroidales bacterium]|nr:restriction endonuclease subunit S [Bacteroidales bacterium]